MDTLKWFLSMQHTHTQTLFAPLLLTRFRLFTSSFGIFVNIFSCSFYSFAFFHSSPSIDENFQRFSRYAICFTSAPIVQLYIVHCKCASIERTASAAPHRSLWIRFWKFSHAFRAQHIPMHTAHTHTQLRPIFISLEIDFKVAIVIARAIHIMPCWLDFVCCIFKLHLYLYTSFLRLHDWILWHSCLHINRD